MALELYLGMALLSVLLLGIMLRKKNLAVTIGESYYVTSWLGICIVTCFMLMVAMVVNLGMVIFVNGLPWE